MSMQLECLPRNAASLEAGSLAEQLGRARAAVVEQVRHDYRVKPHQALKRVEQMTTTKHAEHILQRPANSTSWWDLDVLASASPERAVERWEQVKCEARAELESGHRAAEVLESSEFGCWKRAQFLALRDDLATEWGPRNGIEWALIDTMAQSFTLQFFWTQRLVMIDALEQSEGTDSKLQPPRLSIAGAVDQAAAMVDRFNRIFIRALRQLRDLRRYTPNVVVQNAGQVNIGGAQVNVAGQ